MFDVMIAITVHLQNLKRKSTSCINSPNIQQIFDKNVICAGSHSCINSASISLSDESILRCYALKSCANVKNISIINAEFESYIECSEQEACADSTINVVNRSSSTGIRCDGYLNCKNFIITISNSVHNSHGVDTSTGHVEIRARIFIRIMQPL